jgi:hypothetical protein
MQLMVRHVVMFKFKPETDTRARVDFARMLTGLKDDVEVIQSLEIGQDFLKSPRSYDILLVVDLEDEEALKIYAGHPDHQPVLKRASEICQHVAVLDYEREA